MIYVTGAIPITKNIGKNYEVRGRIIIRE